MAVRYLNLHGLQARLILVFLALVLIPLAGIGLYDHFFTNNALVPQVVQRLVREVHLQAKHLVSVLEHTRGDAFLVSNLRSMRMLRSLNSDSSPDMVRVWRQEAAQDLLVFSATRPGYYQLQYIDASGSELARVDFVNGTSRIAADSELRQRQDAGYFQETMALAAGDVYVSSLEIEQQPRGAQTELVPVIRYALKLDNDDGLVVISLHAAYLLGDLVSYAAQRDNWAVFDQNGYFLLYAGRYLNPEAAAPRQQLQTLYPQAEPLLKGGVGTHETDSNVLVFNTIYPTATQPDRFWVIYFDIPKDVLLADITNFHYTVAIFLLGTFITAVALAMLASERIVTPILDLKRRVEQFGRNGVVPALPLPHRRDEIGALNIAFHHMALELDRKRQKQRRLIEQLITAQEEERKLVAFDLHDGLIQQMVGARFHLTNYRQQCGLEECKNGESLQRGCDALTEAIAEGRRIIEGLRPAVLDDLGLAAALEEITYSASQAAGWKVDCTIDNLSVEPDKTMSVTLFRIAQEALNNIRKHAQAEAVSVHLSNGDGLQLTIRDNGCGFNPALLAERSRGMGITTMRERAHLVDGRCIITSAPGMGTTVEVWVPNRWEERQP